MKLPAWLNPPTESSWNTLFSVRQSHRSLFRVSNHESQQIFPSLHDDRGIWSADQKFVPYQTELALSLTEKYAKQIDAQGFASSNALISNFLALTNRSGTYMDPTSVPMMSNRSLKDDLDLADGFLSERDRKIFRELHRYMFRTIVPAPMAMRKAASSGAPYFDSRVDDKKKALAVFNDNSHTILPRFLRGELEGLYLDYGLFFGTYMGRRIQPDSVSMKDGRLVAKPREVNDELYSRTSGAQGNRRPANKTVYDELGRSIEGIFACRQRPVYAYPAMYNYFLTEFFTPMRAHYLKDGEYTWKHRDPASIVAKLEGFESIKGYDVKQFDQSIQPWMIDAFCDEFDGFLKPDVIEFMRKVFRQPFYQPHPGIGAKFDFNPCFGDPFDLSSFNMEVGLPSGVGPNPDMGKFFMTFAYLCMFDRHFRDVLEVGVRKICRGEHDRYGMLDMGDDAVLGSNDPSFWVTADAMIKETFYVRVEPEDGVAFLGNVLYRDPTGRLRAAPNIATFLLNRLCPEHGVQHWSRKDFAGTGWVEGKKHYSTAPLFGEIWADWDDIHRKHFGEGVDTRFIAAAQEERRRGIPSLSEIDVAVMENPDKLYYRYDIEEVHPWVLDKLVGAIQFEDYFPSIEQYFI